MNAAANPGKRHLPARGNAATTGGRAVVSPNHDRPLAGFSSFAALAGVQWAFIREAQP